MKEEIPALIQPPAGEQPSVPPPESDPPAPEAAAAPSRSGAGWPGALAVIALVATGLVGWQVFTLRGSVSEVRGELAQRLSSGDSSTAELRALSRQQQESIAALQAKLGALESQVAATEGQAAALETLYQEFSRTREDRVVAEVEQAIGIAAQQLELAGNVEAALIALQAAETRLAAQDRGQLQPLRRALLKDIEQLKAAPQVDVTGIALQLEGLLERVDSLPLAFADQLAANAPGDDPALLASSPDRPAPINFIMELARDVWREIRMLVRVERLDQAEPVLLAPAQSTFLRENLKIRLLTARLALLARDGRTFAADLAQARGWIERFFSLRDQRVQDVVATLAALEAAPVKTEPVALTESFAALQLMQARSGELPRGDAEPRSEAVNRDARPSPDAGSPAVAPAPDTSR